MVSSSEVSGPPMGTAELLVLRTCAEVHIHRNACAQLREGFPASCPLFAATEEQQRLQAAAGVAVAPRRRIGFVPTLGGLHAGHLSLVRHASRMCDEVWVSIFLNPTQFQDPRDYTEYPMDIQQDIDLLRRETSAKVLFLPTVHELYPHLKGASVPVGEAAKQKPFGQLQVAFAGVDEVPGEGSRRPGFFKGIGEVVLKLFSLVRPTHVFLGQKDFLQTVCMRALCRCSCMDTRVVLCPTARLPSGLCFASRNEHLDASQLQLAERATAILKEVESLYNKGEREVKVLEAAAAAVATRIGAPVAYLAFNRQGDGVPVSSLGAPQPEDSAAETLPCNDEICASIAVKAAPLSSIVDNFVLSDTHKHGDLLPAVPNTPEACHDGSASPLPLYLAPCMLLLRSLSLRLLHARGEEAPIGELEALELSDPSVARQAPAMQSKLWPWVSEREKRQKKQQTEETEYYLLRDCREASKQELIAFIALARGEAHGQGCLRPLHIQRLFVAPSRRRNGIAEAFFSACMLLMYNQQQQHHHHHQQEVTCVVPRLALKVVESMGFTETPGSAKGELGSSASVSLTLEAFVNSLLRP